MDRVQWINDRGGCEIGKIYRPKPNQVCSKEHGVFNDISIYPTDVVLVLPYHGGEPVFVEYGKLSPRPSHEVLEAAK